MVNWMVWCESFVSLVLLMKSTNSVCVSRMKFLSSVGTILSTTSDLD